MARAPDTLKPYQPTIRNRISTALLGDAKASSVRGRFVKGLMGDLEHPQVGTAEEARKALSAAGIPGVKYLDANSRNAGGWHITPPSETVSGKWMVKGSDYNSKGLQFDTEAEAKAALAEKIGGQTRNFVVFDEKLITILKKYGWVPGAALPAAAVAEYTKQTGKPPPTVPMV